MSKYAKTEIEQRIDTLETMVEYEETLTSEEKANLFQLLIDAKYLFIQEHNREVAQ